MANAISVFKEDASKLIERLATEIESFFLLASVLFALDSFLRQFSNRNLDSLSFDWSMAQGINIGSILLFLTFFSFIMTVLSPLLILLLRNLHWGISGFKWWDSFFNPGEVLRSWPPYDHVSIDELEKHALSQSDKFYLLELVDRKRRNVASVKSEANKLAYLAFSFLLNAAINAFLGFSGHDTLWWKLLLAYGVIHPHVQNLIGLVGLGFCGFIAAAIKPVFMYSHLYNLYIYYPPLAREQRQEQEREQANRPARPWPDKW